MSDKLPPPTPQEQEQRLERERLSRRTFLMKSGLALNGLVALVLAVPIVRYLLSAVGSRTGICVGPRLAMWLTLMRARPS